MIQQTELFEPVKKSDFIPNLEEYDKIIVAFSGGKDSLACLLYLLRLGVEKKRIELWHHKIDGDTDQHYMDWPVTESYCRAVADAFDIPIYFSWKKGGFRRELWRKNQRTAPMVFETPEGLREVGGNGGSKNTRLMFPQTSADLSVRWCSAYLKIDVCASAIRNQNRFRGIKTLVVTGERGEESKARSNYEQFEAHKSDLRDGVRYKRHVDHWRPVLHWYEADIWNIIEEENVRAHPAYYLSIGRVSCAFCIFESDPQLATAAEVLPGQFEMVAGDEDQFEFTIKQGRTLRERKSNSEPYNGYNEEVARIARSTTYNLPIMMNAWELPSGAYGDNSGPI